MVAIGGVLSWADAAQARTVVVAGDSWAEGMAPLIAESFHRRGHTDMRIVNAGIGGTTAGQWAGWSDRVPGLMREYDDVRFVVLSLGANDLVGNLTSLQADARMPRIEKDLRRVVEAIVAQDADVTISLNGYDYMNLVDFPQCGYVSLPASMKASLNRRINEAMEDLAAIVRRLDDDYPQVRAAPFLGVMQKAAGQDPDSRRPSPTRFMDDCIHPNTEGYRLLAEHIYRRHFAADMGDTDEAVSDARSCCGCS